MVKRKQKSSVTLPLAPPKPLRHRQAAAQLLLKNFRLSHISRLAPRVLGRGGLLAPWASSVRNVWRHATPRLLLLVSSGLLTVAAVWITAIFYWPRSVTFSYSEPNCLRNPMPLPNLIPKQDSKTFRAMPRISFAVAGYPIYSQTTCVTPLQPPKAGTSETIRYNPLRLSILQKTIRVTARAWPAVAHEKQFEGPVRTKEPLVFQLDEADRVFDYRLGANKQETACIKKQRTISCDIPKLNLSQSATYTFRMQRLFKGKPSNTVFEQTAATVGAVQVTSSSIAAGQIIYNAPTEITLVLNKEIKKLGEVVLEQVSDTHRRALPIKVSLTGQTVVVHFTELPRDASLELTIKEVTAADGGYLPAPFTLPFHTSGGPKVLSINIGYYKVPVTTSVVLTFDSAISTTQSLGDFIRLEINGREVTAAVSVKGNTATIQPSTALPRCTSVTVRVLDGLQNQFGITGGSNWRRNSRTICQTVFSIGSSVQGRAINAYRFGDGSSAIVFIGTTHGNEKSTTSTLTSWIDYLESHYDQIPGNRTIVVIPNLNPDGYASNRRTNANTVDLNRNFPANDWVQNVTMPDGSNNANGGGSAPLSEPESNTLANYILSLGPRLVLTYHATAGVVIPNDSGDSVSLAQAYDQKSNINFAPNSQTSAIFQYNITGTFEGWLHDKHDIPALLIELWTESSNEFSKNQNAMWYIATLP